jgi:hypothetical protein
MGTTIAQLSVAERENGYRQSYNDAHLIMILYQAENPGEQVHKILCEISDRMKEQMQIREISGWAHSIEVTRDEQV